MKTEKVIDASGAVVCCVTRDQAKMLQVGRYVKAVKKRATWLALQCLAVIRAALRGGVGSVADAVAEANRTVRREGRGYALILDHCYQYGGVVLTPVKQRPDGYTAGNLMNRGKLWPAQLRNEERGCQIAR